MDKRLNQLIKILLIIIIIGVSYFLLPYLKNGFIYLFKILLPITIGFIIAFILVPLVDKLEEKKVNRKISSIIIMILVILFFIIIMYFCLPIVIKEAQKLINNLPYYIENLKAFINEIQNKLSFLKIKNIINYESIESLIMDNNNEIFINVYQLFQATISYIIIIIISPILAVYFMIDYHKIKMNIKEYLIKKGKYKTLFFFKEEEQIMHNYFKGIILIMIILSLISTLIFFLIGVELPLLWGIVIGITNIIPYLGPYIGGGIVLIFTLSTNPKVFLLALFAIIIIQIIESNFITPKIESKSIKSHPILVIFFISFFGSILGIFGMIISIPTLSCIQTFIKALKINKLEL